jgi:hypothetical protein
MKCKAMKDGLIDKTQYVREGEVFETNKCPSWAVPVRPAKPKPGEGSTSSGDDEGGE